MGWKRRLTELVLAGGLAGTGVSSCMNCTYDRCYPGNPVLPDRCKSEIPCWNAGGVVIDGTCQRYVDDGGLEPVDAGVDAGT